MPTVFPFKVTDHGGSAANHPTASIVRDRILENDIIAGFFEGDPDFGAASLTTTVVGSDTRIDTLANQATGTAATGLLEASGDARRPYLAPGDINGLSAIQFKGDTDEAASANRSSMRYTGTFDTSVPYTVVFIGKLSSTAGADLIWGRLATASTRALLVSSDDSNINHQWGSVSVSAAITEGEYFASVARYDGTDICLRVNGVESTPVTASGSSAGPNFFFGSLNASNQFADMNMGTTVLIQGDLDASANATLKGDLEAYALSCYGLTL